MFSVNPKLSIFRRKGRYFEITLNWFLPKKSFFGSIDRFQQEYENYLNMWKYKKYSYIRSYSKCKPSERFLGFNVNQGILLIAIRMEYAIYNIDCQKSLAVFTQVTLCKRVVLVVFVASVHAGAFWKALFTR